MWVPPYVDPEVSTAVDSLPMHLNEHGYDPWGFHPETAKPLISIAKQVYRYFRPRVSGIENIPEGRVLLIGNHGGQFPFDGLVVQMACLLEANPPRWPRAMAERYFPTVPFIAEMFARSGVVLGDPLNCKNLLEEDNAILVFPEGARGSGKPWAQRYRLVDFGRGFVRLALQTGTPIVPIAIVGSEESIPSITSARPFAKLIGAPYFPVPFLLPVLGPFAYLPLPTRFHLRFGAPIRFEGRYDDEDAVIQEKADRVKHEVQSMIDTLLAERECWFS